MKDSIVKFFKGSVTLQLLILNTIVFLLMFVISKEWAGENLAYSNDDLFGLNAWWTAITANFVHFSWSHFTGNMFYLIVIGIALDLMLTKTQYWALVIFGGLFSSIVFSLQPLMEGTNAVAIGFSGVISAYFGFLFITVRQKFKQPWVKIILGTLFAVWILKDFFTDAFSQDNIAYMGHLGGVIGGILYGLFVKKRIAN